MRRPSRTWIALSLATATLVPSLAAAGERSPISLLPTLATPARPKEPGEPTALAGLTVKEAGTPAHRWNTVDASGAAGYCLVARSEALWLSTTNGYGSGPDELWRFTEADGKAKLERTRFETADLKFRIKSRQSIELASVAKAHGVTVWGFREANNDVTLLARGSSSGREVEGLRPDDGEAFQFTSSDCTFGAVRLAGKRASTGTIAQLRGELPPIGTGKDKRVPHFIIDASLSKLSRDPEPTLSVRVRLE